MNQLPGCISDSEKQVNQCNNRVNEALIHTPVFGGWGEGENRTEPNRTETGETKDKTDRGSTTVSAPRNPRGQ